MHRDCFAIQGPRRRTERLAGWLLLVLGLCLSGPARSATEAYVVRDVRVDVTAETSAAAREQALAQGHVKAMQRLMQRLVLAEDLNKAPQLSAQEISNLVRSFQVDEERRSPVRYMATLTFEFRQAEVRKLLRSRHIRFADTMAKPLVVLPVYGDFDQLILWEEPNLWREAWLSRSGQQGLVPLVLPLGDLRDLGAIDAPAAVSGQAEALASIAQNYGAAGVLVSHAIPIGDFESGLGSIRVSTATYETEAGLRPSGVGDTTNDIYRQAAGEDLADLLGRVVDQMTRAIESTWKDRRELRFDAEQTITAYLPVTTLADFQEVRRRLDGVGIVQSTMISYVSPNGSMIDITFIGDTNQLAPALAENDLVLVQEGFAEWTIRMSGKGISDNRPVPE